MDSETDAWLKVLETKLETFDAAYSAIKSQVEEPIKVEIRRAREKLRMDAIIGDPRKAATEADGIIQWMRGLAQTRNSTPTD